MLNNRASKTVPGRVPTRVADRRNPASAFAERHHAELHEGPMPTTAIFAGRYVQGEGSLGARGDELARLGHRALVIADRVAWSAAGDAFGAGAARVETRVDMFGGECADPEIARLGKLSEEAGADLVVAFGGGKAIDTAKAVAHARGLPAAIVPTIASTDAPCSALSVIYTPKGAFSRYLILPRNPELVLVDTAVVARAPVRLLVAGIGDALSTWFEAEDCRLTRSPNMTGRTGPLTAYALARLCYDVIREHGVLARTACARQVVTPAVEHVVEANTLLSGLGFESGGLSAAHAIHNGLTALDETHDAWHGEKVAIGTLALTILTDRPAALIEETFAFCEQVGLPTTLGDIGLADVDDARLMVAAERACAKDETIWHVPVEVTPQRVLAALRTVDAEGTRRRKRPGTQPMIASARQ
jgi:glycerol dehydrogenase